MISKLKRLKQVLLLIQEKKQTKNIKEMNYITVLDFEAGRVFQYDVGFQVNKLGWNPDNESCEDYLINKGHNLKNCQWMVHENPQVITN